MSVDVVIIGSANKELEEFAKAGGMRVTSAPAADLSRLVQPDTKLPAVIVLDVRQQLQIPPALAVLKKAHPGTGIVIVAAKLEAGLMLEAMRAGVSECVQEPIRQADFVAAIERVVVAGSGSVPAEVYAVVGAKGGVGATSLAVNIATVLSTSGATGGGTLLIDLHSSCGDAALFLGAEARFSMFDALENTHRLDDQFLKGLVTKSKAGPDVLASPDRIVSGPFDPAKVRAVVAAAARCYRYVVLDTPRSDASVPEALQLAKVITIVTTQELTAVRSANRLAAALSQRYGPDRIRLVLSRYDRAATLGQEDLERAVGGRIGHTFPSDYRLAIDALNKGKPVVVDNHNKLASAYVAYARSLAGITTRERQGASAQGGILSRLTGRR